MKKFMLFLGLIAIMAVSCTEKVVEVRYIDESKLPENDTLRKYLKDSLDLTKMYKGTPYANNSDSVHNYILLVDKANKKYGKKINQVYFENNVIYNSDVNFTKNGYKLSLSYKINFENHPYKFRITMLDDSTVNNISWRYIIGITMLKKIVWGKK